MGEYPQRVTESQKLDEAMRLMQAKRGHEIERRARRARRLVYTNRGARHGRTWTVCTDDIRDSLGIESAVRKSRYSYANNINGAIFRDEKWVLVGWIKSTAKGSHGNRIGLYTLKKYEAAARSSLPQEMKQAT